MKDAFSLNALGSQKNGEREHGGGVYQASQLYGGEREQWIDLSTGINPNPYPFKAIPLSAFHTLPDRDAFINAENTARDFWNVPNRASALLVPGLSLAIAQLPFICANFVTKKSYSLKTPTYNEYEAAFNAASWRQSQRADIQIIVSPNNPTGEIAAYSGTDSRVKIVIIDESFADATPAHSLIEHAHQPHHLILKGLGKFWGLAGVRLGFLFGDAALIDALQKRIGPWAVSGVALHIAHQALSDRAWAQATRAQLQKNASQLDALMARFCTNPEGTTLFRLYQTPHARKLYEHFAHHHILTRIFSYNEHYIRMGIPLAHDIPRLHTVVEQFTP